MQICKSCTIKHSVKVSALFFILSIFCGAVFSQNKVDMPPMPPMPEMPVISFPEYGDTFYHPSVPGNIKPADIKKTDKEPPVLEDAEKSAQKKSSDALLKSLVNGNVDTLTASDISSLYELGMFGDVSSIMGYGDTNYNTSSLTSMNTTNVLLQQVLTELEEMKETQKKETESEQLSQNKNQQNTISISKREPSILRFRINGYNIADSLSTVFFSEPDTDGTFLLTADRKYIANQQVRTETVYFLFRTIKGNGTTTTYEVTPSLVQDKINPNSFVYQLCQQQNITAEKTGNLIVLRYGSENCSAEMLLDLDE